MKFSILLLLITLQATARSYSQNISLSEQNAPLARVFAKIEKKTGYLFWYESKLLEKASRVDIDVRNASLRQTLDACFRNQPLTYAIVGKTIVLQPKIMTISSLAPPSLFVPVTVTGTVTDARGTPLPGVTVSVKETGGGTTTDASGHYSVEVPGDKETLIFSSVGYVQQAVPLAGRSVINIILKPAVSSLDQLVVVGYGTRKKGDLTGSVSSISRSDFDKQPIIRLSDAIKGRAAGVFVKTPNGAPGAGVKIRIRGENSINGDNTPLYVIDGFVGGDIRTISPDDIASIDILKDASATAIYGSRGSNGVVIITTRQGRSGKPRIDVNAFYSIDKVSKKYDLLNGAGYMQMVNEWRTALGQGNQFTDAEIAAVKKTGGTDWQDAVMRTGGIRHYELAFSGGHGNTNYYLSGNIADQQGIILNSWYKRYGLRFNLHSDFTPRFHIDFNSYGTFENSRNNYNYFGRNTAYGEALAFPPNIAVKDTATGDYTSSPPSYGPVAGNPVFAAETQNSDNNLLTLLSNVQLSYDVTDHLDITVSGGVNGVYYNNPSFDQNAPGTPVTTSQGQYDNGFTWALQNTDKLHYRNTFGGIHSLDVSLIYEQQQSLTKMSSVVVSSFPSISLGYNGLGMGIPFRASSGYSGWSIQSYLGRVNYALKDRYLFTFTFRADGSSKFQAGNKYGYFPSGAFAWRASDEPFVKATGIFQDLKLRLSYGLTGSQAINPYQTLTLLSEGNDYLFNGTDKSVGIGPGVPGNPNLKWETTAQADVGLDFTVLGGRLGVTADFYHKKTTDLLLAVPIPGYLGSGTITSNVGSLRNQGVEALVSGTIVDSRKVRLSTSLNFSLNRNRILNLGASDKILTNAGYASSSTPYFILQVGKPLGLLNGLVYEGLWQEGEKGEAAKYGHVPGDPKFKDLNGDGKIDGGDMVAIGNTQPSYTLGWNTDIRAGSFDLNILFNAVQGNDVWDLTRYLILSSGSDIKYPTSREILDHWTPSNTNTDIPGFSKTNQMNFQSSRYIEDGSFIRLSNLTLGYNLPSAVLAKWKIIQGRLYLSAQNLFIITRYKGEDPELSNTSVTNDVAAGIDNATFPLFRTYTIGISLGL